jgi:hypothetical protein
LHLNGAIIPVDGGWLGGYRRDSADILRERIVDGAAVARLFVNSNFLRAPPRPFVVPSPPFSNHV